MINFHQIERIQLSSIDSSVIVALNIETKARFSATFRKDVKKVKILSINYKNNYSIMYYK